MNSNDSNDREMEQLLEAHFASGADNVPPTPDLWVFLEDRLGEQAPRPLLAGIRDWAFPTGGFNGVPPIAATAAAVVVVAIAGSVWFVVGGSNLGGGPGDPTVTPPIAGQPTSTPMAPMMATAAPAATARVEKVVVVETVIVEKPVTIIEKIVETVVVEKMVEGKVVVVLQTVIVEKPVTITEKVVEL